MQCKKCSTVLENAMNFCHECGFPVRKSKVCQIKKGDCEDNRGGYFEEVIDEPANKTVVEMILVEGDRFLMGSDNGTDVERPIHRVTLDSFYIGKYPVTFSQYDKYCEETGRKKPQDREWGRSYRPVVNISWYDTLSYCNWLSKQDNLTPCYSIKGNINPNDWKNGELEANWSANGYRLPTEAEWEYAARGGNRSNGSTFSGSNYIGEVAWYDCNSAEKTNPVGGKKPNELGICDMSGNVWEWCWGCCGSYSNEAMINPREPQNAYYAVLRGGSWCSSSSFCRVSLRLKYRRNHLSHDLGFRMVRAYN